MLRSCASLQGDFCDRNPASAPHQPRLPTTSQFSPPPPPSVRHAGRAAGPAAAGAVRRAGPAAAVRRAGTGRRRRPAGRPNLECNDCGKVTGRCRAARLAHRHPRGARRAPAGGAGVRVRSPSPSLSRRAGGRARSPGPTKRRGQPAYATTPSQTAGAWLQPSGRRPGRAACLAARACLVAASQDWRYAAPARPPPPRRRGARSAPPAAAGRTDRARGPLGLQPLQTPAAF
jgi:hypothetical protein